MTGRSLRPADVLRRRTVRLLAIVAMAAFAFAIVASGGASRDLDGARPAAVVNGYLLAAGDGGVFAFGDAPFFGSLGNMELNAPIVAADLMPNGSGYILFAEDGGVFTFGAAPFFGSLGSLDLNAPIVAGEITPSGAGYAMFAADGGVFAFGDAPVVGSLADRRLNAPIVDGSVALGNDGYRLAAKDGGVFGLGSPPFFGSHAGRALNAPITALMTARAFPGYALAAEDGGVFALGPFGFHGAHRGPLAHAIVDGSATPTAGGYLLAAGDGGVFAFGDAAFRGSLVGTPLAEPIVAIMSARNATPNAVNDAYGAVEDTALTVGAAAGVLANDTDPEDDPLTVTLGTTTTKGTLALSSDGSFLYTPNANANGADSFTYTASDGITTDTATVAITIAPVNDPPVAGDDAASVPETGATPIVVLANDTDLDGDALAIGSVGTGSTAGTVTHNGVVATYTPPAAANALAVGETLVDAFTYTVDDGNGGFDTATVTVTVTGANDAPTAIDDAAGANEGGPAIVVDVLGNDSDADASDSLAVTAVDTTGTAGTVTNNGVNVSYDPAGQFESLAAGETATDTFTYTVSDGNGGSDTATVTVTVTGQNDGPTAVDDAATVTENAAATTILVLANDTDPDASDTLTVSAVDTTGTTGSVTNNGTDVTYDATAFDSLAAGETATDTFTYTVSDGNGGSDTATVTVTVTGVNDAPVANDDAAGANENGPAVVVDVLANDTDADATDTLVVSAVDATGTAGSVTNNGTDVTYDPNGQFESLAAGETDTDTFTYTASDGNGGSDTATVTVTITGANDGPTANDDAAGANENGPAVVVDVLANDTDPDASDTLTVSAVDTTGTTGTVTNNGTDVTYDPNGQFESLAAGETDTDTFTYTASDGNGGTDTATVTVTITGQNDAPAAGDDTGAANEDGPAITVDVLANDSDTDSSDTLTVTAVNTSGTLGLVTNNATDVSYSPMGAFESLAAGETATDTFTYTVGDGNGGADTATVTITITGANDAPEANDDGATASEDGPSQVIAVRSNDTDVDATDTLTVTSVDTTGTVGSITNNGTDVTYDPNGQFEALAAGETAEDTFTYTISDGNGGTDTATVTVTVSGQNDAPSAVDDASTVTEDAADTTILVLANDSDPDTNDTLTVSAVDTTGTVGSVTNNGGDISYDATAFNSLAVGESDTDTFTYTVSDGNGGTDTATVTVTIDGVNDAPDAVADTATTSELATVDIDVLANDSDPDTSDSLTVASVDTTGTQGTVTNNGTNVTYDPNGQFDSLLDGETDTDTFTYTASDGNGGTDTATVTVTITGVTNIAPVAVDDTSSAGEDGPAVNILVLANDSDPDGDSFSITSVDLTGTIGSVTNNGTDVDYNATGGFDYLAAGESEQDSFTYTITDSRGGTDTATVTITVTGVNDPVFAVDDFETVGEDDASTVLDVLGNDSDADVSNSIAVQSIDTTGTVGLVTNSVTSVSYDPIGMFEHLAPGETATDTFAYTVGETGGTTDTATVTVTITGVNDNPDAVDDAAGANEDGPAVVVNVLGNDTDVDTSDSLTVSSVDTAGTAGTVTITNAGADVTYDPNGAFESLAVGETDTDTFTYTAADLYGGDDTATVTITITGANDAPVAADDLASVSEDGPGFTINVLGNDSDSDSSDTLTVTAVTQGGALGTLTNNGTDVSYDPNGAFESLAAGESTTDTFSYTVGDGNGGSDTATVTVTINGVNDAPVAVDDLANANEDGPAVVVNVLGNDTDADTSDTLTVSSVDTTGTTGSVTITNAGADVTYDPNGLFEALAVGETDTDTFTYTVSDGNGGTDTATVTVTITGQNEAPVAADDAATVPEQGAQAVNVLGNDTDGDASDTLVVSSVDTTGTQGSVTNNGTDVTYDPDGAFDTLLDGETGTDTFTYTVSDGNGGTDTATVTITITGVTNPPPVANADTATFSEDGPSAPIDVLANDTEPDGQTLSVSAVDTTGTLGSVTNNGTDVTYDPAGAFESLAIGESATDTFTYTASDGFGGTDTATVTVTVNGVNDAPVAVDDLGNANEGGPAVVVNVLGNDTDADSSDTLTVSSVDTTGTSGTVTITNAGADVTYDPNGMFEALAVGETDTDTFTYTVSDGNGGTDTATVTITITGANEAPVAVDDVGNANEDGPSVVVNVLGNDTDADTSDTLTVSSVDTTGTTGTVTITNAGADVTYDPNGAFESLAVGETDTDTFTYTASDGNGGTDTATVTITITGVNDAPVAVDDLASVSEDGPGFTINVLGNDSDSDSSDTLTVTAVTQGGALGTLTNNGTDVSYDPNGAFESLAAGESTTDTFSYTVGDGNGGTDTATVTVTINGANDAPVAVDDAAGANEGGPATTVNLLGNDTDADTSDTLTVSSVDTTGTTGSVTITNAGADVSYDPNGLFELLAVGETTTDTFTYTASDGNGGTDTATVTITITGQNDAPTAVDDTDTTPEHSAKVVDVLANDTEPDTSDTLSVSAVDTTGTQGTVTNNGTDVTYDPNGAFDALADGDTDTDTFTYTVSDGNGGTDTATVTITVTGSTNAPPVANDDAAGTGEDNGPGVIDVLANDTEPDSDPMTVTAVDTTGTTGIVTITNAGADVTYDPNGAFESLDVGETATDTFTYTVSDGFGGTHTATVTVTINGADDAPVAVDDAAGVDEDSTGEVVFVLANDTDADTSDTLSVSAVDTTGTQGSVTNNGTDVTYDPNGQFESLAFGESAQDTFTYTVTDGDGATDTATATITVNGVNDAVDAVDDAESVDEDNTGTVVNVLVNDTDADSSDTLTVSSVDTTGTTGTVTITNAGADVTYDPNGAYESLAVGETDTDTFTYTVSDGNGGTDTATVTITITGVNDAPVAVDDAAGAGEDDGSSTVFVLANDTDADTSDTLTVSAVDTTGTQGLVTNNGTDVSYDPNGAFESLGAGETDTDTFTYTASDGNGGTDTALVTITITGVNDAPAAVDDAPTVGEDASGTVVTVLTNDTDADGDTLTVSSVDTTGTTGTVTITNAGADVTYDPNGAFESLAVGETDTDTFTYTISDGNGGTDTATVTVTVEGANDPPNAVADATSVSEDAGATGISVLANDTDPDTSDTLSVSAVNTTGTVGSVTNNGTNVSYNPNGQFESLNTGQTAQDTFTYTASDGNGGTDTATVTVTITGVNDAPIAANDAFATAIGNTKFAVGVTVTGEPVVNVSGNLLTNDTDVDDLESTLVAAFNSATAGASVTVNSDGSFTYVSPPGLTGVDTFTYKVLDTQGAFTVGTVSITVAQTVWYVDNSLAPAGNGTSVAPYNSLSPFSAGGELDDPGDHIFVYQGAGNYAFGIPLEASQKLWGQPFGLLVSGTQLVAAGGTNPVIGNAAGNAITVAEGVDIQRVNVGASSGNGLAGTGVNTFTIGSSTTIQGAAGAEVRIDGGNGSISIPSTITGTGGRVVEILNRTGGTITFSGPVSDTAGTGVSLVNNGGATNTFTGGVTLSTGASAAFAATGGGTVNVTGATNTITTTSGTALNVTNTTIGSSNITFRSISATANPSTGILLDTTGASGGLIVTGNASAGTGGTITGATVDGIRLRDTRNTSLSWMNVNTTTGDAGLGACHSQSAATCHAGIDMSSATNITINRLALSGASQQGISGDSVNGLTITNSTVNNAGNATDEFGMLFSRLSGTVLIQDVTIDGSEEGGVRLYNDQGTLNMTLRRVTITNNDVTIGEDAFQLEVEGTGTANILVDDVTFDEIDRDGIDGIVEGSSGAVLNLTVKDSDITDTEGGGIILAVNNTATLRATITGNTIRNLATTAINATGAVNSVVHMTILNNTISHPAPPVAQNGFGIRLSQEEDGDYTARIEGNNITGTGFQGILARGILGDWNVSPGTAAGNPGTMHATIKTNTVGLPLNVAHGIELSSIPSPAFGGTAATENQICAVYTGNNATGNVAAGIRARQGNSSLYQVEGLALGAQTGATTTTYLGANNTSSPAAQATAFTNYTGVVAGTCRTAVSATLPS